MICNHCGHGALRIHVTAGQAECLSDACGKTQVITSRVDRDRLRRIALRKEALRDGKQEVKGLTE